MPGRGERDLLRECVLVVGGMRTVGRRGETSRYMWKRRKGERGGRSTFCKSQSPKPR